MKTFGLQATDDLPHAVEVALGIGVLVGHGDIEAFIGPSVDDGDRHTRDMEIVHGEHAVLDVALDLAVIEQSRWDVLPIADDIVARAVIRGLREALGVVEDFAFNDFHDVGDVRN